MSLLESKLTRQHEWHLREIREEQAHEARQLQKRAEAEREEAEGRCQRATRELAEMRAAVGEREQVIAEIEGQVEWERQRAETVEGEREEIRVAFEYQINELICRHAETLEAIQSLFSEQTSTLRIELYQTKQELLYILNESLPQLVAETQNSLIKLFKQHMTT